MLCSVQYSEDRERSTRVNEVCGGRRIIERCAFAHLQFKCSVHTVQSGGVAGTARPYKTPLSHCALLKMHIQQSDSVLLTRSLEIPFRAAGRRAGGRSAVSRHSAPSRLESSRLVSRFVALRRPLYRRAAAAVRYFA